MRANNSFINKISKTVIIVSLLVAVVAGIAAIISYYTHGDNSDNKTNIGLVAKGLFLAVLVFGYRLIYVGKK